MSVNKHFICLACTGIINMICYTSFFDISKQSIKLYYTETILIAYINLGSNVINQSLLRRLFFFSYQKRLSAHDDTAFKKY